MKIKLFKSGSYATMEKSGAWYLLLVRNASGNIVDKTKCDDYRMALDYYRAFCAIAKACK
jgi:hypothetical protein